MLITTKLSHSARYAGCVLLIFACLSVSTTAPAITGGSSAPNDEVAFSISLPNTANGANRCTGVLVTPTRMLLAAHCTNGANDFPFVLAVSNFGYLTGPIRMINQAEIFVGSQGGLPSPTDLTSHTPVPNFPAHRPTSWTQDSPVNFASPAAAEKDLAVIPLNKRVPMSLVAPALLPFQPDGTLQPCNSSFVGRFVGYGPQVPFVAQTIYTRNAATADVYRSPSDDFGDTYRSTFGAEDFIFGAILDELGVAGDLFSDILQADAVHWLQGGDSGGPMFQGSKLCGINSAYIVSPLSFDFQCDPLDPLDCGFHVGLTMDNLWARVDSQAARDFLLPRLLDARGNLHGTCGSDSIPGFEDIDTDADGIPDGCDPCAYVSDPNYMFTGVPFGWNDCANLPTGQIHGPNDWDCDGVPDICDNCPSAYAMPNPYAPKQSSLGIVVAQPDADGDGVGDVCDTCPNSDVRQVVDLFCCNSDADCQGPNTIGVNPTNRCVPIAPAVPAFPPPDPLAISPCPGFAGRCAMGRDLDRDFVADNCDSCPPTTACKSCSSSASCGVVCGESHNTGQTDSDGDGVGDVCDNCAGKGSFPPEVDHGKDLNNIAGMVCNVDVDDCSKFDCVPGDPTCIPSDKHSVCVPGKIELGTSGSLELKPAHCSRFPDKDGDGLGNICDNCVNTPNVETSGTGDNELNNQPNCNLANEIAIGTVPYPFVGDSCDPNPCNRPGISFAPHAPNPKDVTGDLWVTMSYDAQILPNSQQKQNVPGQVPFPHQYTGTPVATVGSRYCQCDDALLHDALKCRTVCPIDAPNHYDTSEQWSEASVAPTPPLGPFQLPPNPVDGDFPADAELQNLSLAAPPKVVPTPTDNLGAYLSAPKSVSWDVTRNDAIHFDFLPGTTSPVSAFGVIGVLWTGVRNVPQAPLAVSTFLPYSNRYNPSFYGGVDPIESGANAKSACPTCEEFACFVCDFDVDMKDLLVHPETEQLIAQSALGGSVITDSISPAARSAVFDTTARWLTVAERGGWLSRESVGFATLSSDGSSVKSVLAHRNGILTPVTRRTGGGGVDTAVAMLAAVDPGPFPASRTDFGAILSDNEQGIFVFGGKLASGQLANDLWLFDIGSGRWWELSFSGPTPRKVLAATYIPQTRSLWLVDAGTTAFSFARLLRYDIPTQKFHVVGTWPRTPIMDRIELSGAPDGDLLLTGSSSWLKHVVGVVLHPVGPTGNVVTVTGAFKRQGKLAIEPTLSVSLLTLPLASNGPTGVEHVVIPADEVLFKPKKKGKGPKPPFIGIRQCL